MDKKGTAESPRCHYNLLAVPTSLRKIQFSKQLLPLRIHVLHSQIGPVFVGTTDRSVAPCSSFLVLTNLRVPCKST